MDIVDFFNTPEEGTEITNIKPDQKPGAIKDIFEDGEKDGTEDGEDDNSVDFFKTSNTATTNTDTNKDYTDIVNTLIDGKLITALPEDISLEENTPTSVEDLVKILQYNIVNREQNASQFGKNSLLNKLPKEIREAVQFAENDGDALAYIKSTFEDHDIKKLDPSDISSAEKIVRTFYKSTDFTEAEIDEKIEELKDLELLSKEASKLKPKLEQKAERERQEMLTSQEAVKSKQQETKMFAAKRVVESLVKGFEDTTFSQEEGREILDSLFKEEVYTYGGHQVIKTPLEVLIDKHKYDSSGDPSKLIKAYMILEESGKYSSKLTSKLEKKLKDQFITEHSKSNNSKFKLNSERAVETVKKQGKFKFI